jgi:hypothetical protein
MGSPGEGDSNERASQDNGRVERPIRRRTLGRAIREDPNEEFSWSIRDLSTSGAFLETVVPLELDSEFDLSLIFGNAVIHVTAKVARIQQSSEQHVGGAAVEFTRLSAGAKAFLESYIEVSEGDSL